MQSDWYPQIGDRVRYKWAAECPGVGAAQLVGCWPPPPGYPASLDGAEGEVYDILTEASSFGHPYLVRIGSRAIQCALPEIRPAVTPIP